MRIRTENHNCPNEPVSRARLLSHLPVVHTFEFRLHVVSTACGVCTCGTTRSFILVRERALRAWIACNPPTSELLFDKRLYDSFLPGLFRRAEAGRGPRTSTYGPDN